MKQISKTLFVVMGLVMLLAVGCATTSASLNSVVEPEVQVIKTDVKETVASIENQIRIEKSIEEITKEVIEEVVAKQDFNHKYIYEFEGNEIQVDAHNGYGYVTYPSYFTDQQISQALSEFVKAYGDFGVTYKKIAPGSLYVQYAEGLTKADFDYVANIAAESLSWYFSQNITPISLETKDDESKVAVPVVIEQTKTEEPAVVPQQPKVEQTKQVETKTLEEPTIQSTVEKKGISQIWIMVIIVAIIVGSLCCYFCYYKKLKNKESLEGNKE